MTEVIEVNPQGYCGGVMQAIRKAVNLRKEKPEARITLLGSLVHNRYIQQVLEELGIEVLEAKGKTRLELLDEIDEGIVVFTAHGVSPAVRKKAQEKGLEVMDASCPFVLSTQKIVAEKIRDGNTILYIGKKGHPESEAVYTSSDQVILIERKEDIPDGIEGPVFVTNQTTMSVLELQDLFDEILKRYPDAEIHDEICSATRVRQQALLNLKGQDIDVLVVVGDPTSNNTRKLADTGKKAGIPEILQVETASDPALNSLCLRLQESENRKPQRVAVTSGASTPTLLKDQVVAKLQKNEEPAAFDALELLEGLN